MTFTYKAKIAFDEEYNPHDYAGGYFAVYSDPMKIGLRLAYRF